MSFRDRAVEQQTRSAVVTASRGTIYDSSLNTLAISATAEDVNISPMRIAEFVESQKEKQEKAAQKAADKAADKGETTRPPSSGTRPTLPRASAASWAWNRKPWKPG